jgi:hypothetical protein
VSAQVAADLRAAAEVLRRDGWTQGGADPNGRRCVVEAILAEGRDWRRALDAFRKQIDSNSGLRYPRGKGIAAWNDAPGRTADEVIAALEAAADAAEAEQ